MIVEKAWGTRERLLENNLCTVDRLVIEPKGFCSHHYHTHKYNLFRCEKGKLLINISDNGLNKTPVELCPGMKLLIKPSDRHWFKNCTHIDVVVYEICYMDPIGEDDINRFSESGVSGI